MNSLSQIDASAECRLPLDPRIPLWLFPGPSERGPIALAERLVRDYASDGKVAIVFIEEDDWARAWNGGSRVSDGIAIAPTGAVCCYAGTDIVNAFYQLHLRKLELLAPPLDYDDVIVVLGERLTTGDFATLVQNDERLDLAYRISRIVDCIEPEDCTWNMNGRRARTIGEADTLVLMDTERSSSVDGLVARTILMSINPLAVILDADQVNIWQSRPWRCPLGNLDSAKIERVARETGMVRLGGLNTLSCGLAANQLNRAGDNAPGSPNTPRAVRVILQGELDLPMFMQVVSDLVETLGARLHRMSALLNARHVEQPIQFQIVGGSLIQPSFGLGRLAAESDICLVASGMDTNETFRALEQCAWKTAATGARFEAAI